MALLNNVREVDQDGKKGICFYAAKSGDVVEN